jgi:hypothetical protein
LASTSGLRCGRIITAVMKRSRVVAAATHVSQISGSGKLTDGPPGNRPPGA